MIQSQYNTRNAGVKRLMQEAKELKEPTDMYWAQPYNENLFEWHFTVRGPGDSDFEGGIYHGRIIFPFDYPMKPPNLMILTPNGRFELNKKICLSISGYHPETWLPSWSIRTALLALIGFMPSDPAGAIGSLKYPPEERKKLAKMSVNWTCKECGICMKSALKDEKDAEEQPNVENHGDGHQVNDVAPSTAEQLVSSTTELATGMEAETTPQTEPSSTNDVTTHARQASVQSNVVRRLLG